MGKIHVLFTVLFIRLFINKRVIEIYKLRFFLSKPFLEFPTNTITIYGSLYLSIFIFLSTISDFMLHIYCILVIFNEVIITLLIYYYYRIKYCNAYYCSFYIFHIVNFTPLNKMYSTCLYTSNDYQRYFKINLMKFDFQLAIVINAKYNTKSTNNVANIYINTISLC